MDIPCDTALSFTDVGKEIVLFSIMGGSNTGPVTNGEVRARDNYDRYMP